MPGSHLFEYAVIRIVPRVEREEFLNAGVILYCRDRNFLDAKFTLDKTRLSQLSNELDCEELKKYMDAMEQICKGAEDGGPIAKLDVASRFRWLTARRSTIVQTSVVHPGLCESPRDELLRLYNQLVL